jgi:hypothetical protein
MYYQIIKSFYFQRPEMVVAEYDNIDLAQRALKTMKKQHGHNVHFRYSILTKIGEKPKSEIEKIHPRDLFKASKNRKIAI